MFCRFFSPSSPLFSLASYLAGCCCHSSSWFTFSFLAGPPVLSESIIGTLGRLPCNVTPPIYEDRVALVIWYKVGLKTPIYRWVKPPMRMHFKPLPALPCDSLVSLHTHFHSALLALQPLCQTQSQHTYTDTHTHIYTRGFINKQNWLPQTTFAWRSTRSTCSKADREGHCGRGKWNLHMSAGLGEKMVQRRGKKSRGLWYFFILI